MLGVIASLTAVVCLLLITYRQAPYSDDLWWTMLRDADVARSLRAIAGAVIVALLALTWAALHPNRPAPSATQSARDLAKAQAVLQGAERAHGEANLMFTGDKRFVFTADGRSVVMYRPRGGLWIAMGDPVGPMSQRVEALTAFHATADTASASPVIYAASEDLLPALIDLGYAVRKIGETALVDLPSFSLEGSARAKLRQAKNRLLKEGWQVSVPAAGETVDWEGLQAVSDAWLARQFGREKEFSLGRFERAYLARFPIAIVAMADGPPVAFASLWPTPDLGEISVDLMRHGPEAPNGVMDFLFVGAIEWSKAAGFKSIDLGMTPLAGLTASRYAPLLNKLGATLYEGGEDLYGFKGLRSYKSKFAPTWRPVFIAAPGHVSLPLALANSALLTSGGVLGLLRLGPASR